MSTALTIRVDETKGRLSFSRYLVLGSEYDLAFDGIDEGSAPTIVVTNSSDEIIGQSVAGQLKMNTASMASLFENGSSTRPKSIRIYAYEDSVVLGIGIATLMWSPLSFENGAEPELVSGLSAAIADHVADTDNPHNVTAAQAGAAPLYHTHDEYGNTVPVFQGWDGKFYQIRIVDGGGGIPTMALSEYEPEE